ncbi:MAG: response regulator transcription factor [Rhodospirillaceae bacterium]|nr:response regulator transcription factor [Rhodospirillaceae bacterium]
MRILIADDHKLFRAGLVLVLKQLGDDLDISEAGTGSEAIEIATADPCPELILMDLDLPGMNGLEALSAINEVNADIPIVILSAMEDQVTISRAMELGARGYIPKSASGDVMINSLKLVISGGVCMPPGFGENGEKNKSQSGTPNLTRRQLEVLRLMATGNSNKEIASELGISENTVRVHISAIITALDATNRTEAAYSAMRIGLIPRGTQLLG